MNKIIDSNFLKLIENAVINLNAKAKTNTLGKRRSNSKGSSIEFSDYREYVIGDDFRRIDWSAYARFEKLFLKLYMEEVSLNLKVFLDCSKSMELDDKKEYAIKLSALFSYLFLNNHDKVSVAFVNDDLVKEIGNISNKNSFYRFVDELENLNFEGNSNIDKAIDKARKPARNGYTLLISDFLYEHNLENTLKKLTHQKQKIIICHVLSKNELRPPLKNSMRLKDSETSSTLDVDINQTTLEIYQKNLTNYLNNIKTLCHRYKANYFLVDTADSIEAFINKLQKTDLGRN